MQELTFQRLTQHNFLNYPALVVNTAFPSEWSESQSPKKPDQTSILMFIPLLFPPTLYQAGIMVAKYDW